MPRLVVFDGDDRGKVFVFAEGISFVGRGLKNDITLKDRSVSGRHLKVFQIGRKYFVEDLKSTNGTQVNNQGLEPGEGFEVAEGDMIRIGRVRMRVESLPERSWIACAESPRDRGAGATSSQCAAAPERRTPQGEEARLMRDVSNLLKRSINLHGLCRKVLVLILENLPRIDTAVLVYLDPPKRGMKNKTLIFYARPELIHQRWSPVSGTIIDRVLDRGKAVRVLNGAIRHTGNLDAGAGTPKIRSILCIPLVSNAVLRGALYVHSTSSSCGFRKADLRILDTMGTWFALVLENALK